MAVLILLVGVFLAVRVASRTAYEASAEILLGIRDDSGFFDPDIGQRPSPEFIAALNQEVGEFLESPPVVERAATLLSEAGVPFDVDATFVEKNFYTHIRSRSGVVGVHFRADDPDMARQGANAIVEAYRQLRTATPSELDGDWEIVSGSLAPTPSSRIDTLGSAEVSVFALLSILAVYLTWKWWPESVDRRKRRELVRSVTLAIRALLSGAAGIVVFLGTMIDGCNDVDGVPAWDRCTSWLGTPILVEWSSDISALIIPLILGSGVGVLVWWASGLVRRKSLQ